MDKIEKPFPNIILKKSKVGLLAHLKITALLELGDIRDKSMFFEIYLEENNEILCNHISGRVILGSIFIKHLGDLSDRETITQI